MGSRPLLVVVCVLALMAVACSEDQSEASTTTTTESVATTTTPPPTTTTTEPDPCSDVFCVVYRIRPEATWSDGTPVTADDFVFTYQTLTDPVDGRSDLTGYELITDAVVIDDRTALFAFSNVFGPWKDLFPTVLPAHVMTDGFDPELAYTTTAGPFLSAGVADDGSLVVVRNTQYWSDVEPISGQPLGNVRELRFEPTLDVRESLGRLEDGELNYMNPRPLDWMVSEAAEIEGAKVQVGSGPFWEHIDFNHDDPLLSQRWVREVISMGIDRQAIADETLRRVDPRGHTLDNTFWMTRAPGYESHFEDVFDPEAAEQIMIDRFCDLGDDGVYSCQSRRMSFTWATTFGDADRERVFEMAAESLQQIGIELVPLFMTPSRLFSAEVFFGGPDVWQIMSFSWKAAADPYLANSTYYCVGDAPSGFGDLNVNRYCDSQVETLVRSTDGLASDADRVAAYNEADQIYLSDLAIIPLYQKPSFAAWTSNITGPILNPSRSTDLWNVGAWSGQDTVVIAVQGEPRLGSPIVPADEEMAMIRAPMLAGAYGVTPDLEYVPVLVEDVELISGNP